MRALPLCVIVLAFLASGSGCVRESIDERLSRELKELGFPNGDLPPLPEPFGTYEPYIVVDKHIYLTSAAAQRPDGEWVRGIVPTEVTLEEAYLASQLSCVHAINRLSHATGGDLSRIRKITRVTYMTAAPPTFPHLQKLAGGCSEMLVRVFGRDAGGHTGNSFAVPSLPWNLTHEVEIVALLR